MSFSQMLAERLSSNAASGPRPKQNAPTEASIRFCKRPRHGQVPLIVTALQYWLARSNSIEFWALFLAGLDPQQLAEPEQRQQNKMPHSQAADRMRGGAEETGGRARRDDGMLRWRRPCSTT